MTHTLLALLLAAGAPPAADWPQWRGPARDGNAADPPAAWPERLERVWQAEVGEGHSGPVVAGGQVFTLTRVGGDEVVRCLRLADGSETWADRYATAADLDGAVGSHGQVPRSTPCVADGRVYTFGVGGVLSCYAADSGKRLWRQTFAGRFKKPYPLYGVATSPLVLDRSVVVWAGGHDNGALTALDAATGRPRWAIPADGPGYASPVVAELAGQRQLVTQSQRFLLGVDPAAGKELWKVKFTTGYDQNSVTPLVVGDKLIYSGYERGLYAGTLKRAGGRFELAEAWELREHPLYMSSPVAAGTRVFGLSSADGGTLVAVDTAGGTVVWKKGRMGEYAALIRAGGFVLVQTTAGKVVVLKADAAAYEPVAEYAVGDGPIWAHPALAGDVLLVKGKTTLTCWRAR